MEYVCIKLIIFILTEIMEDRGSKKNHTVCIVYIPQHTEVGYTHTSTNFSPIFEHRENILALRLLDTSLIAGGTTLDGEGMTNWSVTPSNL